MLFDYIASTLPPGTLPPGQLGTVWSQFPFQPLTPSALTPFSYSVIAELASRAWYVYYDRLGFDPTPRTKVVRRYKGNFYFNLSLCAQMEADNTGVEPLLLQINGQRYPLARWEKPGFMAGFKLGRAQKRMDDKLVELGQQIGAITDKARTWYLKTQGIQRWGQAEVLQIMEEIERVGVDSMVAFFAARINLGKHYARLVTDLSDKVTHSHALLLINNAVGDPPGMVESAMLSALSPLVDALREPAALAWLKAGNFANWRTELPSPTAIEQIKQFLSLYGHRAVHEGEMAQPRWTQDVTLLMYTLLSYIESPRTKPTIPAPQTQLQTLLDHLPPAARKQAEQSVKRIGELHKLQSHALHALAYILAGTRTWAMSAAREAMVDKRLQQVEEVFCFELEEIKQMMTGEWNISSLDEIRATVARRQVEQSALQQAEAPAVLLGDTEALFTHTGLPAVAGDVASPLCVWDAAAVQDCRDVIIATELLDSGYALTLPHAAGFVATAGTLCDPFIVAAQAWQRPVAYAVGNHQLELANGTPAVLHVSTDGVLVSHG